MLYNRYLYNFIDDDFAFNHGLPLPKYDAFLLYDDGDIHLAATVVDKLEIEYKLKVILSIFSIGILKIIIKLLYCILPNYLILYITYIVFNFFFCLCVMNLNNTLISNFYQYSILCLHLI